MGYDPVSPMTAVIYLSLLGGLQILFWVLGYRNPARTRPGTGPSPAIDLVRDGPYGAALIRRLRWRQVIHSLIGLGLTACSLLALDRPFLFYGLPAAGLLWQSIGSTWTYDPFQRKDPRSMVACVRKAQDGIPPRRLPFAEWWLWECPPLLALGLGVVGCLYWVEVADARFAGLGPSVEPPISRRWVPAGLMILPMMAIVCWNMARLMAAGISDLRPRGIPEKSPDGSDGRSVRRMQWLFLCVAFWLAATLGSGGVFYARYAVGLSIAPWVALAVISDAVLIVTALAVYSRFTEGRRPNGVATDTAATSHTASENDETVEPNSAGGSGFSNSGGSAPARKEKKKVNSGVRYDYPWGPLKQIAPLCVVLAMWVWSDTTSFQSSESVSPWVVGVYPTQGARDVSPGLGEIRLEFDQPMDPDFGAVERNGPPLPEFTGEARWVDDRTWVRPVRLEARRRYRLVPRAFRSPDGRAASIDTIEFHTAGLRPTTAPASE
jgi:hypothetical protein